MWTRYYNERSEAEKEQHAIGSEETNIACISYKPRGLYMSVDDAWVEWLRMYGTGLHPHYTHKKSLLNPADFFVLEITEDVIAGYARPLTLHSALEELNPHYIDWCKIRTDGYDGVYVPQHMINASRHYFSKYGVQLGCFDVETLVLWTAKEKLWSTPVAIKYQKKN